ncbi:MAG: hypothetical protein ABI175_28320 [Polyangiales bacterium]
MSLSLARLLLAAAVSLTASPVVRDAVIVAPVPLVAPAATQAALRTGDDDLQARVEIGPAVLRIYDASGKVIAVE